LEEEFDDLGVGQDLVLPAKVRHHDRHRQRLPRVLDRNQLGDHPPHRSSDHVGRLDAQRIEQPGGVGGHVIQAVGLFGLLFGRETDVPVVEANDVEAACCDLLAEAV